jgi:hypothetical protein
MSVLSREEMNFFCSRSQSPDWERNSLPNPVWKINQTTLDLPLAML